MRTEKDREELFISSDYKICINGLSVFYRVRRNALGTHSPNKQCASIKSIEMRRTQAETTGFFD